MAGRNLEFHPEIFAELKKLVFVAGRAHSPEAGACDRGTSTFSMTSSSLASSRYFESFWCWMISSFDWGLGCCGKLALLIPLPVVRKKSLPLVTRRTSRCIG